MLKKIFIVTLLVFFIAKIDAQELLSPSFSFSHKKTSYITLMDGSEIKGIIKSLDREKGLVELVKIEDETGKKHKLKAEAINFMYLPPSGLDKLSKAMDFLTDAQKWNDEKLDQDLLNQGYAFFENTNVKIKKKELILLMQLLNPGFSKTVQVYHDPLAKETMSLGVGGVKVAGGLAKSYFLKMNDDAAAFKIEKKNYKEEFVPMWNKCDKLIKTYTDIKWNELTKHIVEYTDCK